MQIRRRSLVCLAVLGVFGIGAGVTYAAQSLSSTTTTVINACQLKQLGTIRIVDNLNKCSAGYVIPISWNVQGPAGSTGPTCPAGPAGQAGAPGAKGAAGETGAAGPQGSPGIQGLQGERGLPGQDGRPGSPGAEGPEGDSGGPGPAGSTAPTGGRWHRAGRCNRGARPGGACFLWSYRPTRAGRLGQQLDGSFTSSNGLYSLSITNVGITLKDWRQSGHRPGSRACDRRAMGLDRRAGALSGLTAGPRSARARPSPWWPPQARAAQISHAQRPASAGST